MKIKLTQKRAWGNVRFYPNCDISKDFLKVFKQECLSLDQAQQLKKLGVEMEIQVSNSAIL